MEGRDCDLISDLICLEIEKPKKSSVRKAGVGTIISTRNLRNKKHGSSPLGSDVLYKR
jgi:hypothetical protein